MSRHDLRVEIARLQSGLQKHFCCGDDGDHGRTRERNGFPGKLGGNLAGWRSERRTVPARRPDRADHRLQIALRYSQT